MSTPEVPTSNEQTPSGAPLAPWGTRAAGLIIDWAPLAIVAIFARGTLLGTLLGLAGAAYWAYIGHLDGTTGQSPGKAIMGTRLVDQKGETIGSGAGIGRKFLHILDGLICGLGFLLPIIDAKRQTIADKLMDTFVVTGADKKPFAVDLWMPPKQAG